MGRTDPGAKYFYKHFVNPDVLYIFLYISGHIWLLLGTVAKSPMLHVVVVKAWVAKLRLGGYNWLSFQRYCSEVYSPLFSLLTCSVPAF